MHYTKNKDLFGEDFFIPIQALSWKQPFASLMLHGKIETRTWNTLYRGDVLICASAEPYLEFAIIELCHEHQIKSINHILSDEKIANVFGKAIAIGYLSDCRLMTKEDEEKCFVEYATGPKPLWCHIYTNVKAIKPFDWKGSQGWKEVPQEIKKQIQFL